MMWDKMKTQTNTQLSSTTLKFQHSQSHKRIEGVHVTA